MLTWNRRNAMTILPGTETLDKWVSPEGDLEVTLTRYENYYSVTTHLVEIPEEGEEIPEGDEFVDSINIVCTKDLGRAQERFIEQIPASHRNHRERG